MSMPSISQITPFFQLANQGINALGQGLQGSYNFQQQQQLGDALQKGDYSTAMSIAARMGNTDAMMKLAPLAQEQKLAPGLGTDLAPLYGGGATATTPGTPTVPTPTGSGSAPIAPLQPAVTQATNQYKLDASYVPTTLAIESAGGRNLGSRGNPGQFDQSTANSVGMPNATKDPNASVLATGALADTNAQLLQSKLGRPITPSEAYLAHQQGAEGAFKLISNPNARAADLVGLPAVAGNLPGAANPGSVSAGQYVNYWNAKYNATASKLGYTPGPSIYASGSPTAGTPGTPSSPFGTSGFQVGGQALGQPTQPGVGTVNPALARVQPQAPVQAKLPATPGTVTLNDGTVVNPSDPDAMAKLSPDQKVEAQQKQIAALPSSSTPPAQRPTPVSTPPTGTPSAPIVRQPATQQTAPASPVTPSGLPTQQTAQPQPQPRPGGGLGGLLGGILGIPGHLLSGLGGLLQGQGMAGFGGAPGLPQAPGPQPGAVPAALGAQPQAPAPVAAPAPAAPTAPGLPAGGSFGTGVGGTPTPAQAAPAAPAAAPGVASAQNPDPPVMINGKAWTRASAAADDSPNSPSVVDVAKAQGITGLDNYDPEKASDEDITEGLKPDGDLKYGTAGAAPAATTAPATTQQVATTATQQAARSGMTAQQRYLYATQMQAKYAGTRYADIFAQIAKQAQDEMQPTTAEKEYEYAKAGGYTGTFEDWQSHEKTPTDQTEFEYAQAHGFTGSFMDFLNAKRQPLLAAPPAETAEQKAIGEAHGQVLAGAIKDGQAAEDQVRNLNIVSAAVENPDLVTGPYADRVLEAGKFLEGLTGIPSSGTDAGQVLAKMNTQLAAAAGRAMSSRFTQQEFAKLKEAYPGLTNTPEGNQLLVKILQQDAQRKADLGQIAQGSSSYAEFNTKKAAYDQQHPQINPFTNQPFGATDAQGRPLLPRPTSPNDPVYKVLQKGDLYIDPTDGQPHKKAGP